MSRRLVGSKIALSRRTLLKSVGASIGLPSLLEAKELVSNAGDWGVPSLAAVAVAPAEQFDLANQWLSLKVAQSRQEVTICLSGRRSGFLWSDGAYAYRAVTEHELGQLQHSGLKQVRIGRQGNVVTIKGKLASLDVEHTLSLDPARPILEEQITLRNPGQTEVSLHDFGCGMVKSFASTGGHIVKDLEQDRWIAVPFRDQPDVPVGSERKDFTFDDLLRRPGREPAFDDEHPYGYTLASGWGSEGWAWLRGETALGVFKFNQTAIEFSGISPVKSGSGAALRFGGAAMVAGNPLVLSHIKPGASVALGLTRYQLIEGGYREVCYAFRDLLDQQGAHFPADYDPPVLWNELFGTDEWNISTPGHPPGYRMTRPTTYTREILFREAAKAREYHCQALYLDPGWDTDFGTLLWGTEWLGNREDFIRQLRERYGLGLGFECVFATWLSLDPHGGRGVSSWPRDAMRMSADGKVLEGKLCMGSRQYLEEAVRRLMPHFRDGVSWMMVDGNWYPGECHNPAHGHPVPYTIEDHWRANMELVERIHRAYPRVYIELHDPVTWGTSRYSPIYYKYAPPLSHTENWAFEMMWHPLEEIKSGKATVLYNINLACNIPWYVTVNLDNDNEHCLALWWFASTCRHLGMGGTNENPLIAAAHKAAMAGTTS